MIPGVLAGIGAALFGASVLRLDWRTEAGMIDAGFIPGLCGLLLMVLAVAQLVTDVRNRSRDAEPAQREAIGRGRVVGVAVLFVTLIVFVLAFDRAGAVPALTFLIFSLVFFVQRERLRASVTYTAVVVTAMWFLFDVVLRVPLPAGWL